MPGKEKEYDKLIDELGGVDLCLGGLGINGHIAFNEPAETGDSITAEEYAELGTRVLPVSRETQAINAYGYKRGDLRAMPTWCITVGMKQILASRKIYIALNRDWQHGIAKHVFNDKPQPQMPASLLQNHKDVEFCMHEGIAKDMF
jgi:glucosamine-6-phosphate deaminase